MDFIDLKSQQKRIRKNIDDRIRLVLNHGRYIMGPEVYELEERLAKYVGTKFCISCSSGTDALLIPLLAKGIGPGDAVLTTPFTYIATAEVISLVGAQPIFVDIYPETLNIDPTRITKAISNAKKVAMSLSDQFCVDRHKPHFLELVKNKLDVTFANEQEISSLIEAKNFEEVVNFSKQLNKLIVITRGEKGAIAIKGENIVECGVNKNLKIVDLTGAGDLFAAGFLHGYVNNLSIEESLNKGTEMSSKVIQQIGARL